MFKFFKTFFKSCDCFGKPISFFFYGKTQYNTAIGGFLTLSMTILILVLSKDILSSVLYRENVHLSEHNIVNTIPASIKAKSRFAITFNPYPINQTTFFDAVFGYGVWSLNSSGYYSLETKYYNLTSCNQSHFPMFTKEEFHQNGLSVGLCPEDPNLEFDISGTFDNAHLYSFLEFSLKKCIPTEGKVCASEEEISKILKYQGGRIYFDLIIINTLYDYQNFEQPFKYYPERITNVIGRTTYLQQEVYLTPVTVVTDSTRSFSYFKDKDANIENTNFIYEKFNDKFMDIQPLKTENDEFYISMYIRSGKMSKILNRSYDTFGDYISMLGSLYSAFALIFKLLSTIFSPDDLNIKIVKKLYEFKKKENLKQNEWSNPIWRLIHPIFLFFRKLKRNNSIINETYDKKTINDVIVKEMDMIQLLMRIKEIENIKKILFNKHQRIAINYLSQPKFETELKMKNRRDLVYSKKVLKSKIFKKTKSTIFLKKGFTQEFLEEVKNKLKNENNEINTRILNLIDFGILQEKKSLTNKSGFAELSFRNNKKKMDDEKIGKSNAKSLQE